MGTWFVTILYSGGDEFPRKQLTKPEHTLWADSFYFCAHDCFLDK
jgi:hypothetical protein